MKTSFSSAGLLYVYITGYKEMELWHIEQVDTYSYIGDELYNKISEVMTQNENSIHVFGVIGIEKKVNYVYTILEEGIKKNFDRILNNRKIKIATKDLDSIGNHFYRCVQEFYCDKLHYLPRKVVFDFDDTSFYGIYGSSMNDKQSYDVVNEIVSCWIEHEKPLICGKQLITRSFFLKDFVGRKLITAMPEIESNSWRLIFEGGHQLNISENLLYSKETLNPHDLGAFCSSNVQSVFLNPIYAYGKWFYPNDICEELNTRYVYLPYLQELVKQENLQHSFSCFELQKEIDCALQETDIYKKGKKWEKHVGIQQIRNIAHISSMKGNKTAILFAANGITSDSQEEIQRLAMNNIYTICITVVELKQLQSAVECKKLILDKWKSLQDSIEVFGII